MKDKINLKVNLKVNGELQELTYSQDDTQVLSEVMLVLGYDETSVAVAVNETFIPRNMYKKTVIKEGDSLEIVAPMQGG